MAQLRLESAGATHVGRVRANNEDSYCASPQRCLWAVADGMGGHDKGEWASAAVTRAIDSVVPSDDFDEACEQVAGAVHRANAEIYAEAERYGGQMGSTVVALHLNGARFALFWVGDSRGYVLRNGVLYCLTRDHSQVQAMVDQGLLRQDEVAGHPMSHVLARAVGTSPGVEVDVVMDEAQPGDIFLLCSDGLTNRLSDDEIGAILGAHTHHAALDRLIGLTLERAAPDNVTAVIIGANEATRLAVFDPAGQARP